MTEPREGKPPAPAAALAELDRLLATGDPAERRRRLAALIRRAAAGLATPADGGAGRHAEAAPAGRRTGSSPLAPEAPGDPPADDPLTAVVERTVAGSLGAFERLAEARGAASARADRLERIAHPAQRELLLANLPQPELRHLVEELLGRARAARRAGPRPARAAAGLAVAAAGYLSGPFADEPRARAWAELGNAHRIAGDLRQADAALSRAEAAWADGGSDPLLRAELWSLWGSLRVDQRRFDEAVAALERAQRLYRRQDDREGVARCVIQRGTLARAQGDPAAAARWAVRAIVELEHVPGPRLRIAAMHNLVLYLDEAGATGEAREIAALVHPLIETAGTPGEKLRFRWLTARLAGHSDPAAGRARLEPVLERFAAAGLPYEAALVALDLAALHARLGDRRGLARTAARAAGLFRALGVAREHLVALRLVHDAGRAEALATLARLRRALEAIGAGGVSSLSARPTED